MGLTPSFPTVRVSHSCRKCLPPTIQSPTNTTKNETIASYVAHRQIWYYFFNDFFTIISFYPPKSFITTQNLVLNRNYSRWIGRKVLSSLENATVINNFRVRKEHYTNNPFGGALPLRNPLSIEWRCSRVAENTKATNITSVDTHETKPTAAET